MRVKYSTKFINEVLEYIHKNGITEAIIKYRVSYATLHRWYSMYQIHGTEAFTHMYQQSCTYDFQFKLNAVKYVLEQGFSIIHTACKFLINHITLRKWVRTYQEHGSKGLAAIRIRPRKQALETMKNTRKNLQELSAVVNSVNTIKQEPAVSTDHKTMPNNSISTVVDHVDASLEAMYAADRIKKKIKQITNDPKYDEKTHQELLFELNKSLEMYVRLSTLEMEQAYQKKLEEIATTIK